MKSFMLLTSTGWCICNSFSIQAQTTWESYITQHISNGLGNIKLFPLLSARGLHSHVTAKASRRQVGSFMSDQKLYLILPSLISIMSERFFYMP
jgi:hypothetical protein